MTLPSQDNGNGLLRTALPLFSASFLAQGVNFLTLFLLPWLFPAEEIGPFFVFSAIGQILISIVALRSSNTIVLSRNTDVAVSNLAYSLIIGIVLSLLLFFPLFIVKLSPLAIQYERWMTWLPLIPAYCVMSTMTTSLEYFLNFKKSYRLIGFSHIIKNVTILLLIVVFGLFNPYTGSLILALVLGQTVTVAFLIIISKVPFKRVHLSIKSFQKFVLRYREILVFNTIIAGLQQITSHLPVIIISLLFSGRVVAFYGLAYRILATPLSVWGLSVSQVFYKKCVDFFNQSIRFYGYSLDTLKSMLKWALPFGILAFVVAPGAFSLFMGQEWAEAGRIGRLILPLIVIQSVSIPLSVLFNILRTQKRVIWYSSVGLVVRVFFGLIVPGYLFQSSYQWVLTLFSGFGVLYYLLYIREMLNQVKKYDATVSLR